MSKGGNHMQLPQIRLESQFAQIDMRKTSGQQEIRQPKAEISIQQPKANLSIQTTKSKLTIDQTKAWEDMNLMSTARQIEVAAQEGKSGLFEGIQRRAQEGTDLMKIENSGNPIVQQAIVNGHDQMKSISLKYIPSQFSVKFHYQPSEVYIDAQANKPIIDVQVNKPEHNYERGQLEIFMEKYQQLDINYTNLFTESI
jgi:hypothetical protein